jgi:hypothetical protein
MVVQCGVIHLSRSIVRHFSFLLRSCIDLFEDTARPNWLNLVLCGLSSQHSLLLLVLMVFVNGGERMKNPLGDNKWGKVCWQTW